MEHCDKHFAAEAQCIAVLPSGRFLTLCGHCAREHRPVLLAQGAEFLPIEEFPVFRERQLTLV